jgi:hypothetical protein
MSQKVFVLFFSGARGSSRKKYAVEPRAAEKQNVMWGRVL